MREVALAYGRCGGGYFSDEISQGVSGAAEARLQVVPRVAATFRGFRRGGGGGDTSIAWSKFPGDVSDGRRKCSESAGDGVDKLLQLENFASGRGVVVGSLCEVSSVDVVHRVGYLADCGRMLMSRYLG